MAESNEKVIQEYDAGQIQVLEGLEAVRKRPGMYIGSTSSSGLHHLVYEIVDNSIDEALAGYCSHIEVTIEPGNIISVSDNGRGIPVDTQEQTGKSALEVVFTVLHAGGKFGGGGYKVSGGLHGVGASVVNALSEWLEVQVYRDGKIYQMSFSRGEITQPITVVGKAEKRGTTVRFKPDGEIFDELVYNYDILHTRMQQQAFLNAGVTITIEDNRPVEEWYPEKKKEEETHRDVLCYEGGIREYVAFLNKNKTPLTDHIIYIGGEKDDTFAEVAFQYNDGYTTQIISFANDVNTPEGGMHETGFKTALTRVINDYGKKNNIIKTDADKLSGDDVLEGIAVVISVKLPEPQFEGQTKQKLGNAYVRALVNGLVGERSLSAARQGWRAARCPINCRTAMKRILPSAKYTSLRVILLQALLSRAGTAVSRRFWPCGAKCSTWRRPERIKSTATISCILLSWRLVPASERSLIWKNSAIIKLLSWRMLMWTVLISVPFC